MAVIRNFELQHKEKCENRAWTSRIQLIETFFQSLLGPHWREELRVPPLPRTEVCTKMGTRSAHEEASQERIDTQRDLQSLRHQSRERKQNETSLDSCSSGSRLERLQSMLMRKFNKMIAKDSNFGVISWSMGSILLKLSN